MIPNQKVVSKMREISSKFHVLLWKLVRKASQIQDPFQTDALYWNMSAKVEKISLNIEKQYEFLVTEKTIGKFRLWGGLLVVGGVISQLHPPSGGRAPPYLGGGVY